MLALTPVGRIFGFVPLPPLVLTTIALIAIAYLAMAEALKRYAIPPAGY
jgi:P-type Mg2+ transporter